MRISMLTPDERFQQVVEWNRTAGDYPRDRCVHHLIEEQALRAPDVVAVEMGQSRLTYRELNDRADWLASELRARGVKCESLVGLCLERSPDMLICLLGILKAGAAYVPLDPEAPAARLAMILDDAACALLITCRRLAGHCEGFEGARFWWDDWNPSPAITSEPDRASSHQAAYVIYTSGSTGIPKGVVVEHRAVVNLLCSMLRWPGIRAEDVLLASTTVAFDISVIEFFLPLIVGARLVITPDSVRADGAALAALIKNSDATIYQATPTGWQMLIHAGWRGDGRIKAITGGEPLPAGLAAALLERCGEVWNMYGPTETTVYSLGSRILHHETITIGKPIANTRVYVVDRNGQLLPVGVPGELWIGGDGLARSYLGRTDLTTEKFIADPFVDDPEARVYRSGDRCRWLADGTIECLGRADQQVKIRGHRVELGDVEMTFGRLSDVQQAAVIARPVDGGMIELAAWVTTRAGISLSLPKLRESLSTHLPDYMIPSHFYLLESMPLTPSGKVDRKALERMEAVELDRGTDYVAPQGGLQCLLADLWQSALRCERIGIHDNFFALGGHSLLAVTICAQLAERLKRQVPLRLLLEHPTIDRLAAAMEAAGNPDEHDTISLAARDQPLPMSFAQQGMWVLQQTLADAATYNQPLAWRLTGKVLRAKIQVSLQRMVERHEILRTALVEENGVLLQRIAADTDIPLPWQEVDLQSLPPGQQAAVLAEHLAVDARRPFDLDRAPLWRAVWIQLAEDDQVVGFTFHHSIVDEWSMRLFGQELAQLYAANCSLETAGLEELPVQYADFAVWQRGRLTGDLLERQRRYWKEQLQDPPASLVLPADKARPVQPSGQGGVHDFQIDGALVTGLRQLARTERTTLFTVLLAAYQVWLHRCTGATDLVVGTPIARREQPEIQRLLGFFLNTLPIRTRFDGEPGFRQVLQQTRTTLLEAFTHADLPFEQIVAMADRDRSVGGQPLYQVLFVLLEDELPAIHLDQVEARPLAVDTRTSKNDLVLSIQTTGGTWSLRLEYSADLFSADRAARMAGHLTELLRSITENADCPVNRLNLMPPAERHQVLVEWNDTAKDYPRDRCIHDLFSEQARISPHAIALELDDHQMTYGELDRQSDLLAGHLARLGVKRGAMVGMSVDRSLERIIGLLGILKAGAIYWALEESLPEERMRILIEDAAPSLVLTGPGGGEALSSLTRVAKIGELVSAPVEHPGIPVGALSPDEPAYVSYTSGSTGKPKGVIVPHRGVVRLVRGADYVSLTPEETLLHHSPLPFDASTFEIWGSLLNGGRLVIMPPGQHSLSETSRVISTHRVTTLWLTAGLFHLMADGQLEQLTGLRQLLAGGDVLNPQRVTKARRALPGCRIVNGYGPTENTTFTCCYTVEDDSDLSNGVPIGRPIANTRAYILDSLLQPVPIGVAGELYAGGDGLARGYLNQARLTTERFIPDPFSSAPGAILYRTGDRCRWLENGCIEFLGRLDHQVKIRGFRVELGEIEAVFRKHPSVKDCAVTTSGISPEETRIVAYLNPLRNDRCSDDELRGFATHHLPSYMMPNAFVWLDELPLLANGKLNRHLLPEPQESRRERSSESGNAKNLLELELIRIWEELFQLSDIGRHDNFFDLGGHSLQAVRLVTEIEKLIGRRLSIASLFHFPTIESLAQQLVDSHRAPAWSSIVPLQPHGTRPPIFFIHGLGGDVFVFLELAKLLGNDQPSYGIQSVELAEQSQRHDSILQMASHYSTEITSFQSAGPYRLAGYSLGGIIAYETACQLRNAGHDVDLLALFDTEPITVPRWAFCLLFIPQRCVHHLARWVKTPFPEKVSFVSMRLEALRHRIAWHLLKKPGADAPIRTNDAESSKKASFMEDPLHVTLDYQMKRYSGRLDLFRADDANNLWDWFWRYLAGGGVTFHRIKGNHNQILDADHVPSLASALASRLGIREPGEDPCDAG